MHLMQKLLLEPFWDNNFLYLLARGVQEVFFDQHAAGGAVPALGDIGAAFFTLQPVLGGILPFFRELMVSVIASSSNCSFFYAAVLPMGMSLVLMRLEDTSSPRIFEKSCCISISSLSTPWPDLVRALSPLKGVSTAKYPSCFCAHGFGSTPCTYQIQCNKVIRFEGKRIFLCDVFVWICLR